MPIRYDVHNPPMMACGHAANACVGHRDPEKDGFPACAICGVTELAPEAPDLSGRRAFCSYSAGPKHGGRCSERNGGRCGCDPEGGADSTKSLAFFEHTPDRPHDRFYCGCWGWD